MPIIGPEGVPILGTKSPQEQVADHLALLADEKMNMPEDAHDWVVIVQYMLTFEEADRAGTAEVTGIPAQPPIALMPKKMRGVVGPVCGKCNQLWTYVHDVPCPGMPMDEYIASLDEDVRDEVIARLQEMRGQTVDIDKVVAEAHARVRFDDDEPRDATVTPATIEAESEVT